MTTFIVYCGFEFGRITLDPVCENVLLHVCTSMLSSGFTFFVQNFLICRQIICAFCIAEFSIFSGTRLTSAPCSDDQCHFAHFAIGIFRKMREHIVDVCRRVLFRSL